MGQQCSNVGIVKLHERVKKRIIKYGRNVMMLPKHPGNH